MTLPEICEYPQVARRGSDDVEDGEEPGGDGHVDDHADDVVGDGDKGAGGEGGVDLEFFEHEGDECAEDRCEEDDAEEGEGDGVGGGKMSLADGEPVVEEYEEGYDGAVEEADSEFLEELTG